MKLKLLLILLLVIGPWFLAITQTAYAQTTSNSPTNATSSALPVNYMGTDSNVPADLHTYTQSVFIELASTISCVLTGTNPINPTSRCLGINPNTHKIGYVEGGGGAIGMTGDFIAATFNMPINSSQYVRDVASNFGFTKQTYADNGVGFDSLLPTLKMWKAFRNITYILFTLIFVVIGVGIMFRIKVDPRTAMGIQNQIPKIIAALIFITFSYAIAGFLVDMMYVSIYLIIGVFAQQGFDTASATASTPFSAIGGIGGISGIASGVSGSMAGMVKDIFSGTIGNIIGGAIGGIIGKLVGGGGVTGLVTGTIGAIVGFTGGGTVVKYTAWIITYLVVIIAIFSALLRLWFLLIKCYLYVFLTVVFAPFYVALGALPGQSGVGGWFKGMLANLAVFPTTIAMFMLGKAFIDGFTNETAGSTPFIPPLIGGFANPERMAAIIGLAIILLTPEIATMIKEALKVADSKQGAAIGRSLQAGVGMVTAGPKYGWTTLMKPGNHVSGFEGGYGYQMLQGLPDNFIGRTIKQVAGVAKK